MSDRFRQALLNSHTIATSCEVYDVTGKFARNLDLVDGNITIHDEAATRWAATLTITDNTGELIPSTANSLLAPKGTEVQLRRGIQFEDGSKELVPLGRYRIANLSIDDSGQGMHINIETYDRSRAVALRRIAVNGTIPKGTYVSEAIRSLVQPAVPLAGMIIADTPFKTPAVVYNAGDDPWALAKKLADDCGCEIFFDEVGNFNFRPINVRDAAAPADYSYEEGENCNILYLNKQVNDDTSYSHIIVTGESSDGASQGKIARGEAFDLNPNSPTYFYTFGDVPLFYASPMITTDEQATAVAQKLLLQRVGLAERLQLLNTVDPTIRLNDLVHVKRKISNIDATYIVSKLTYPMIHSRGMNIGTKQRRILI